VAIPSGTIGEAVAKMIGQELQLLCIINKQMQNELRNIWNSGLLSELK